MTRNEARATSPDKGARPVTPPSGATPMSKDAPRSVGDRRECQVDSVFVLLDGSCNSWGDDASAKSGKKGPTLSLDAGAVELDGWLPSPATYHPTGSESVGVW